MIEPLHLSASRLSAAKDCLRKDYLGRAKGWSPAGQNHHFAFGKCWHRSQNEIWIEGCRPDGKRDKGRAFDMASEAFFLEWERQEMPTGDDLDHADYLKAKRPDVADQMIEWYIDLRWRYMERLELLAVEHRIEIPLGVIGGAPVVFILILDKIVRDGKLIKGIEHKTTSGYSGTAKTGYGLKHDTIAQFYPDIQVEGYAWGLNKSWGAQEILVDVAVAAENKSGPIRAFGLLPIEPSLPRLAAWERNQRAWGRILVDAHGQLRNPGVDIETAFPYNESSCVGKYGKCGFFPLCSNMPDMSDLPEDPPPGYELRVHDEDLDWFFEDKVPEPWYLKRDAEGQKPEEKDGLGRSREQASS